MKYGIFLLLSLLFIGFGNAQSSNQILKDSLSISYVVGLNDNVSFDNYEISFKDVIVDSRCPKNIQCVRSGEAFVLVSIFKNGAFIEDQKIKIDASGFVSETLNLALKSEKIKVYGFSLTPYPNGINVIATKDYELELLFMPNK